MPGIASTMGNRWMNGSLRRIALVAALLACPPFARAQDQAATGSTHTYAASDFAHYAPRNALDMLQKVPGFVIREAVNERGLGQATGNVLLNGQRLSGKSNDVVTQLSQVPADDVVRIEIVDGATLDIPGLSGQVANVVTSAEGVSGQWEWRPDFRRYYTDPQLTRGSVSVSGSRGHLDYTFGFDNSANHSGAGGPTRILNPDGSLREFRDEAWTGEVDQPRLSTQLAWKGASGNIGNLNASWRRVFFDYIENDLRTGPGLPDRSRNITSSEGGHDYELGGDYEFGFGPGRLKFIGLDRFDQSPSQDTVETTFDDGRPVEGSRFSRDSEETERIARSEYRWSAGGDWQLSGEYAFNRLDSTSGLFERDADGTYEEIPLPGGTATVQEDRYELMASYGRKLAPSLTFQLAAGGEYSTIEQVGGGGLRRSFRRPKGQVSLAWKASNTLDVNMKLQRRVGQLDFNDFLASVDLANDQANAGNPELVPPQTWELEAEAIRNLGDWGSTSLRAYVQRIDDIVDTIPIGPTGESPGNIDRAQLQGVEWKSTLQLAQLGWQGARLDLHWQAEHSRVRDPLTGINRPISNNLKQAAEISLRDDIPGTSWAWGGDLSYSFNARDYRLGEVGRQWEGPVWDSWFVENKDVAGMTVRAGVTNLIGARSMWQRYVYVDRRTGPLDFYEDRDRRIGPIFQFTVSGKF
jgi:hypothetical protein